MESNGVWKFWNRLELVFYKNLSQKKLNDTALYGSQRQVLGHAVRLNPTNSQIRIGKIQIINF
ncbi:hypothetical protein BWD14_20375 [Leptospira santarosai]|uniref:Uncharacterized protein n=2 Tax=Leptospira santarosai TaxID=28183 RepID=A0AB73LK51_9LEPT|nr:hypothetical protein LSS_21845 [Leptospira santarosai serovar Shermani str. LT 821]AVV49392.1 Uncharacterized protein XB17_00788 [Leptospira santarosai]EPG83907.1 hypothetical protein LEP1GSC048_3021 [Leptospira santarosai serovar Shermani str. 1342KT]ONF90001.1 hypothetical protein BWD14_20375 [Leptospira santarosai]